MAYTEIQPTAAGTPSSLGDYTFNCEFHDSGSAGTMARASMTKDGQTVYKSVSIPNTAQIQGYTIEANENEATVYAVIKKQSSEGGYESTLNTSPIPQPISSGGGYWKEVDLQEDPPWPRVHYADFYEYDCPLCAYWTGTYYLVYAFMGVAAQGTYRVGTHTHIDYLTGETRVEPITLSTTSYNYITYDGKTAWVASYTFPVGNDEHFSGTILSSGISNQAILNAAWTMVYGTYVGPEEYEERLVGRFKIDLGDAGGYPGGGGGWIDPGDWNEDPYTTLHVEVNGALSGRHNDPIYDTSFSYLPSDKATVKQYGCGGDGGHGGGGGAGASTVVIHRIATNKANSHEATDIAKRHGYGSGGGKGGKGGDGIILVYY